MTPELIAILAVGIGLAGLMWQSLRRMEARLEVRIDGVKGDLNETKRELGVRIDGLTEEMREVRDRLSRLEGKMDFLYDYIVRTHRPPNSRPHPSRNERNRAPCALTGRLRS